MESVQRRRFCYSWSRGKNCCAFLICSIPIFSIFLFVFSLFSFSFLKYGHENKKLSLWNTRANGDATKSNQFYTLEREVVIKEVEWISANRIALGLYNGLIEIWQIDEEDETVNSRVIKQFKHSEVSLKTR